MAYFRFMPLDSGKISSEWDGWDLRDCYAAAKSKEEAIKLVESKTDLDTGLPKISPWKNAKLVHIVQAAEIGVCAPIGEFGYND